MQFLQYIDPVIKWIPTLLFILTVASATFVGFCRGYRKSLIFLIHSLVIGGVFIILYFLFKDSNKVDELLLNIINMFMGSDTGLQDFLEVSPNATSVKEVLVLYIPQLLDGGISLILADNGAYLLTLVDLAYSIVFALLFFILYLVFDFIMTIVYYIFYSDKKYKKKNVKHIMKGKSEFAFSKQRWKGSLIGLCRGLVSGLIMISLLGSLLFIVSGGRGDEESPNYDLGNQDYTNIYNAYASISEYGCHGIFKILNAFKDKEGVPYYLFAADIIFSGELTLEEDYKYNVIFREEFATYVAFSKDVLNLMMKYGADDIIAVLNETEDVDLAESVIKIMINPQFQEEFDQIIYDFDSKVYISNLAFSFIDSLISHMDDVEFMEGFDDGTKDLLFLLFKKGYLSESIPYERSLKMSLSDDETVDLGTISSSDLINKQNVIVIYKMITEILYFNNIVEEDPNDLLYFEMMNNCADYLSQLTLFSGSESEKLNSIYRRLYAYIRYNYLDVLDGETEEIANMSMEMAEKQYYIDKEYDSIDWVSEFRAIFSLFDDLLYIYQHNELSLDAPETLIKELFDIYQSQDAGKKEIAKRLDRVLNHLAASKLMANIISSNIIRGTIEDTFTGMFDEFVMPEIKYSNTYDENGSLVSYGEAYCFINCLRQILKNPENSLIFDLLFGTVETENSTDMILQICAVLTSDQNEETIDYLISSKLFRSLFTTVFNQVESNGEKMIYLDSSILESDSNGAKVVVKDELRKVIYLLPDLLEISKPFLEGQFENSDIVNLLENPLMDELLDCRIIEGTFSNVLIISLEGNAQLIMPDYLKEKTKGLITTEDTVSEIRALININNELFTEESGVSFEDILAGELDNVISVFTNSANLGVVFESGIIHYTVSNYLLPINGGDSTNELLSFDIIIPASCREVIEYEYEDEIKQVIEKDTLVGFLEIGRDLFNSGASSDELLGIVIKEKERYLSNYILSASLMTYIYGEAMKEDSQFSTFVTIPEEIKDSYGKFYPTSEYIARMEDEFSTNSSYYYGPKNPIYQEGFNICSAIEELLGQDVNVFSSSNSAVITDSINEIITDPTTSSKVYPNRYKFDVIYDSVIISTTLSVQFDEYLSEDLIDQSVVEFSKQSNGVYQREEIFNFIKAMCALGLNNPEENGFGDSINILSTLTHRDDVYNSTIALGLLTKMINDVIDEVDEEGNKVNNLRTTKLAYKPEVNVYKSCEIEAFIKLLGKNLATVILKPKDLDIKNFSINDVRSVIFDLEKDPNGNSVNSYLMIASVTKMMEDTEDIYIPYSEYDSVNKIVKPASFLQLLDSMKVAGFDLNLNFESTAKFKDSDTETFKKTIAEISKSEILRASISKKIKIEYSTYKMYSYVLESSEYFIDAETHDRSAALYYLTDKEFKNFFKAINNDLFDGSGFGVQMNEALIYSIAKMNDSDRELILKSSLMSSVISQMLLTSSLQAILNFQNIDVTKEYIDYVNILTDSKIEINSYTQEDIEFILDELAFVS